MAKRNKMAGVPLSEVLVLANTKGQGGAARAYGVSQSTVSQYLKRAGVRARTVYVSPDEERSLINQLVKAQMFGEGER